MFQSPRSGKFVSDPDEKTLIKKILGAFQSPRSGKFVSDLIIKTKIIQQAQSFNPLDRGNLYQIFLLTRIGGNGTQFQSPRSGKFVSDPLSVITLRTT